MNRQLLILLAAAASLSLALLGVEMEVSGSSHFSFLAWNLFLAVIPVLLALAARRLARSAAPAKLRRPSFVLLTMLWLLFFPNAPYVTTDYVHLRDSAAGHAPLWLNALTLSAFVLTALSLAGLSAYVVLAAWRSLFGPSSSLGVVVAAFLATAVGIYLGRFEQLNSWDVLFRPQRVVHAVGEHAGRAVVVSIALGAVAVAGFLVLACVAAARNAARKPGTRAEA